MKRLRIICCLPWLLVLIYSTRAHAQQVRINHLARHVKDLSISTRFYQELMGLDTIPEPFHDGRHTWFAIGPKTHLHLISSDSPPAVINDKITHLCFTVPAVEAFVERLQAARWPFEDWAGQPGKVTLRVDGVRQIYFRDPDGYWIEVNDARE